MADPRTFVLIGEFKDGITPELQKINNQLATLKGSFASIGGKGARSSARDIGRFKGAVDSLNETLKTQNQVLRSTIEPMRQYRREVGKTIGALKRLDQAGGGAISVERTNKALEQQIRLMDQLRSRGAPSARGGVGGGGGGSGGGRGRGGGSRGGGGGGGRGDFSMAEFGFAYTLGNAIAQPIQNAVVSGFQIGVGLMTKPFEYFANRLGERMQDEMSDLKAAGGFYSMSQRQKDPFVKSFSEAITFTQENNKVMARLAASLPGKTQDYIEVAKRISDSVARTVINDRAGTMKMAEEIRAGDIRTYGAKSITGMSSSEATKKTIQVLLGDLTKDTVLAGMGGRAGAGGAMGAYGLPQLSERMISQDEVSMGQMQRYSAIFSDPMIMDALQRNINKINATSKNSADRLKAIAAMYKEIVTPELVERYRRTLSGVAETFNTAIFGEETGLFGLGRKMQGLGIKFNEFGQMIDWYGEVTTDVTKAAREDLAIYDLFRDIIGNIGQVLAPIVENLTMIYDPLKQVGIDLNKAREVTFRILKSFNQYRKGFENVGKKLNGADKEKFDATRDFRAALLTIGNVMRYFKVIGEGDFANLIKDLSDPNVDLGGMLKGMIDQFLNSDIATRIGEFVGGIVGSVLTEVAKMTGFVSGRITKSNKLIDGLKKGFNDAGGPKAFRNIFKDVFKAMFSALVGLLKIMPIEAYVMAGLAIIAPAAIQGLAMQIGTKVWEAVTKNLLGGAARVTGAGGALSLGSLLGPIAGVVAALVLFEGGLENATRQLTSSLSQMGSGLSDVFKVLSYALSRLTGRAGDLTGEIDSIGLALLPITALLDLIALGAVGLIEAWDNVVLGFYRFANWLASESWIRGAYSDEDRARYAAKIAETEKNLKATTDLRNEIKGRGDAYRTGLRYEGEEGYANILRQDIASKEARLGSSGLLKAERQKINDDLYWLRKTLARTTGTGDTGTTPGGKTTPSPIFTPPPGGTPPTPATPPPVPKEITATAQNTSALNTKAATQITHAASTDKAANETKKNTATANATLGNIKAGLISVSNKLTGIQNAILSDLNNIQAGVTSISSLLSSGNLKVKFSMADGSYGMGGGGGGGYGGGGVALAGMLGNWMKDTGGAPGSIWEHPWHGGIRAKHADGSLHYAGRAIDIGAYAHEQGPILARIAQFNKMMGLTPTQLFHAGNDPKGHGDHVHVAYANGIGRPIVAPTQRLAEKIDAQALGKANVKTYTAGKGEFGGELTVNAPITINGAGQNAEEIAIRVADLLGDAIATARSRSLYG